MEPAIVDLPQRKVVGMGAKFISGLSPRSNTTVVIPPLWDRFIAREKEIKNRDGNMSYGLVEMFPPGQAKADPDELFYIAAIPVTDFGSLPEGMLTRTIPAGKHARFTHKGMLNTLGQTMHQIYKTWLPSSNVKLRNAPHLEIYDQRFNPTSDQSEFDICLPI